MKLKFSIIWNFLRKMPSSKRMLILLPLLLSTNAKQELPKTGSSSVLGYKQTDQPSGSNDNQPVDEVRALPYLTVFNSKFGPNIEGVSVNPSGKMYAVNYGNATTNFQLGQLFPVQKLIYQDPVPTTKFNGLHFQNEKIAFAVDQNNQRLLKLRFNSKGVVRYSRVYCSDPRMIPPNDLAISYKSGLIFLSAMNYVPTSTNTDGEIWVCLTSGVAKRLEVMGRTNGIELSADEKTLYVTEANSTNGVQVAQKIWQFDVDLQSATIGNKKLFVDFAHVDGDSVKWELDGIKADIVGNLLAVRRSGSQVAVFSKQGKLINRIHLNIQNPTNLEINPIGGNTLFVCGKCLDGDKGCVDVIRYPFAGRYSWVNYHFRNKSV